MAVAKQYQDELVELRKCVETSYMADKPNTDRFNYFRKFVFKSSLSDDDMAILTTLNKPCIEFNITEAFISRLLGEFSKQEPSISVKADDGQQVDPQVINIVEGHIRHIIFDANKHGCEYEVYKDQLSGGFSAIKVYTDYAHEMSFNQKIIVERVFDPTLCGWDIMSRTPTKADGQYCFELYPKTKEEFKRDFPKVNLDEVKFNRNLEGFSWCYADDNNQDVILVCEYYAKKKKRIKIVQLAPFQSPDGRLIQGKVMTMDEYKLFVEKWDKLGLIAQPPAILGKPRWSERVTICRYVFIHDQVLEYEETDYKFLPIVYVPGNDIVIRDNDSGGTGGAVRRITRPYVYHMEGAQKLKNFAGQTWANEMENMVMHKWVVAEPSIPQQEDYQQAYENNQQASIFVYNPFNNNDVNQPLPPPREVQRQPMPQEIAAAFTTMDGLAQNILGSYDAALGVQDQQLSGVAMVEGATQSNAAAMPYIVSFLQAWQQVAEIIIDLIPKKYTFPRTLPIVGIDGKESSAKVNQPGGPSMNYDENVLQVKVEAGVNFNVQKSRALQQIIGMMQASPLFAEFMNSEGLEVLLDNLEIRGIDQLKMKAGEFAKKQEAKQQQMMQMQQQAMMMNPQMIRAQNDAKRLQFDMQHSQVEDQLEATKLAINKQDADTDRLEVMAKIGEMTDHVTIAHDKAEAEKARAAVDMSIKLVDADMKRRDMAHKHAKDVATHHHSVKQAEQQSEQLMKGSNNEE